MLKKKFSEFFSDFRGGKDGKSQSIRSYLVRGSTGSLGIRIANIGLMFLTGIIIARLLGPTGLGDYSYILAIISMIVIPTQLGLPELLVREIAAFSAKEQWGQLKGILIRSNQFVFFISSLFIFVCISFLLIKPNYFAQNVKETFMWSLPMLLLMPLAALRSSALRGFKKIIYGLLPEQVIKPGSLILLIAVSYLFAGNDWINAQTIMALTTSSVLIAFLVGAYWLKTKIPKEVVQSKVTYRSKIWIRNALPFMLLGGLNIINQKVDLVLLGSLGTSEQVGLFDVANRAANFVAIALTAVNQVVGPAFSGLWAKQELEKIQKVLTRSTQFIFSLSLPIALIFIIFGDWFLKFFFGDAFVAADLTLAILCGGYLFNAGMGSVGVLLNMSGNERLTAYGIAVAVITNVVLNIWLIPIYGIEGAAIASLVSFVTWNIFLGYMVYKKLKILPSLLYSFNLT